MSYCGAHVEIWALGAQTQDELVTSELSELEGLRKLDGPMVAAIHARYFSEVFRYARYRLGDERVSEDLTSEVFVRLLEAVAAGRGPRSSLRGWLLETTSNLVNAHFRRAYARPREELSDELPASGMDPMTQAEGSERAEAVRKALTRLTAEQQHVLALHFGDGYSLQETAEIMKKEPNAIKALQFRALAALRRGMGEETPSARDSGTLSNPALPLSTPGAIPTAASL